MECVLRIMNPVGLYLISPRRPLFIDFSVQPARYRLGHLCDGTWRPLIRSRFPVNNCGAKYRQWEKFTNLCHHPEIPWHSGMVDKASREQQQHWVGVVGPMKFEAFVKFTGFPWHGHTMWCSSWLYQWIGQASLTPDHHWFWWCFDVVVCYMDDDYGWSASMCMDQKSWRVLDEWMNLGKNLHFRLE